MTNQSSTQSKQHSQRDIFRALLVGIIFTIAGTFILAYNFNPDELPDLFQGDVSPKDIVAPNQVIYISQIETDAARERAQNTVSAQFTAPDPKVTRQQIIRLNNIFDYMESVRADPYGSVAEKFEWIDAIPDILLSDTIVDQILIMSDEDWAAVRHESQRLLDGAMREPIRDSQLAAKRRELPNKVALDLPEEQSVVVVGIIDDLIKPNTFPDQDKTEAERKAATDAIEPVLRTIEQNELVIRAGQVVTPKDLESLEALGLQQPEFSWLENVVAPAMLMLLTTIMLGIYIVQYTPKLITNFKKLSLLTSIILVFIAIAKFMIPYGTVLPYLYPIAALTIMVSILFDTQLAFILAAIMAFFAGYLATQNPEILFIYVTLSGWTGVLAIGRNHRVNNILWAGVYVGLVNTCIILTFNLATSLSANTYDIGILILEGLLNGIFAAGLALIALFVVGNLFKITTAIQLLDLARPTQPLLRQLLLKAPGTYHHSLMVSNLAEQAAEQIGADSLLVRVMAYYHDIGKMQRPYFFIENQPEGMENVHERLDPQVSAKIIIGHVTDGVDLAKKYRLAPAIIDGIAQHHGTSLVRYFYYKASEAAQENGTEVDEAKFRYPGPKPQIKETGILMLADVSETTVRALKPGSAAEIDEIIQKAIAHHLSSGQLDECDLTIADLYKIRTSFVEILQGIHHPRIKYPEQIKAEAEQKAKEDEEAAKQQASNADAATTATEKSMSPPLPPISGTSSTGPAGLVQQE